MSMIDIDLVVNLMAVLCNLVTVANILFEAQIVVQMCLDFIDEDDEVYGNLGQP